MDITDIIQNMNTNKNNKLLHISNIPNISIQTNNDDLQNIKHSRKKQKEDKQKEDKQKEDKQKEDKQKEENDDNDEKEEDDDNDEKEEDDDDEDDDEYEDNKKVCLYYDEYLELKNEHILGSYHKEKTFGNWRFAKKIILHSYENKQAIEFLWDYLEKQFKNNDDEFDNIIKIYYKNDLDIDIFFEFELDIAKYVVDNLKIQSYKPKGYIFSGDENQNKSAFKIVVITKKNIYTANRYITDSVIGFY
jgi:hypothetical protein